MHSWRRVANHILRSLRSTSLGYLHRASGRLRGRMLEATWRDNMNPEDPIKTNKLLPGYWQATVGDYDLGDPIGSGETEEEAIADLKEQLQDANG